MLENFQSTYGGSDGRARETDDEDEDADDPDEDRFDEDDGEETPELGLEDEE
jgi:hypothetical protein